jgi:hypothetical protein
LPPEKGIFEVDPTIKRESSLATALVWARVLECGDVILQMCRREDPHGHLQKIGASLLFLVIEDQLDP